MLDRVPSTTYSVVFDKSVAHALVCYSADNSLSCVLASATAGCMLYSSSELSKPMQTKHVCAHLWEGKVRNGAPGELLWAVIETIDVPLQTISVDDRPESNININCTDALRRWRSRPLAVTATKFASNIEQLLADSLSDGSDEIPR